MANYHRNRGNKNTKLNDIVDPYVSILGKLKQGTGGNRIQSRYLVKLQVWIFILIFECHQKSFQAYILIQGEAISTTLISIKILVLFMLLK